jgi:hypothetical protein
LNWIDEMPIEPIITTPPTGTIAKSIASPRRRSVG